MTTLDPHPAGGDPAMSVWETVTFADNYWRADDIASPEPNGQSVSWAYNRRVSESVLTGSGSYLEHQDIHFWYHGTLNTDTYASDGELTFTDHMRDTWYLPWEIKGKATGFHVSRVGGNGSQLGGEGWLQRVVAPFGSGQINILSGVPINRDDLPSSSMRTWPSIVNIKDSVTGKAHHTTIQYQDFDSSAHIWVELDRDQNPYTPNYVTLAANEFVTATDAFVGELVVDWNEDNVPAGDYWLYAFIRDDTHERHFHRPVRIRMSTSAAPANLVAMPVSSSQINLTWTHSGTNVSGFELQRRLASGATWTDLPAVGATGRTFANTAGLSADTSYVYRIRALNGGTPSPWSGDSAPARTFLPPASNVSLTVNAVDNSGGSAIPLNVAIATWSGDASNFSTLTTLGALGFTRTFPVGVAAWFSAPPTLPDGRRFQYWLFGNGATSELSFSSVENFNLTGATTAFAHYAFTAPPTRTLTALTIEGLSMVDENSSASYKARAWFDDGTSPYVNANWDEDSGYADISSSGVLDTEAVNSDKTVEIEATYTSGAVTLTATKNVTIRNAASTQTYTLTRNVVGNGEIGANLQGSSFAAGTWVYVHANPGDGYVFDHWSGDTSGTDRDVYIVMDGNRSITAHFVPDPAIGNLRVDISPAQAVAEGAAWRYDLFTAWRPSGDVLSGISPRNKYVEFKDIPGWITPARVKAAVIGGQTTVVAGASATYREILGSVQVTITPAQAAAAGARWRLDGGAWTESGVSLADVSTGAHTISFLPVVGWGTPPSQSITVARGITTTRSGDYTPPAGFPIITSVVPRTGPIAGGTTVTLEGANFQPGATVTFGGVPATSVTVVSSTRITAVTPPRASYGTVPIVLTSGGQTVTLANGFSYLNPPGSNIELAGHIGGRVEAVAVSGSTLYFGEGPAFVVMDVSNASAPVERGRIALPGRIKDIVVVNNTAFVAATWAGVYAIDVSIATAPAIIGFFDTEGSATGLSGFAGRIYVADDAEGLHVLDASNPSAMVRLGKLTTAGKASKVAVGTIGTAQFAFVAERNLALRIINVTNPASPTEIASIPAQTASGITDVKIVGTKLYFSDWQGVAKIFDVSIPGSPVQIGSRTNIGAGAFIDVVGTRMYVCSSSLRVLDLAVLPTPPSLGSFSVGSSCYDLAVVGNTAFAAMGDEGLSIVSVSNPAAMSLISKVAGFSGIEDVWVSGGAAFAGNSAGFHSLSVANPARPTRIATLAGSRVTDIVVAGGKATLVNYGEATVRIVDVSNPAVPSLLGSYNAGEAWNVGLKGTIPLLSSATADTAHRPKLDVLNLGNPSNPQSSGSVLVDTANGIGAAVAVAGDWAFVGRQGWAGNPVNALDVVNISNVASPQKVGTVQLPDGFFRDVVASGDGNTVYVANSSLGIQVVDVSSKTNPILRQIVDPPQTPGAGTVYLKVAGNFLIAEESGYAFVFDIADPTNPQIVGYYHLPGVAYGFSMVGDYIYVAGADAGLSVLRLVDVNKPTVIITSPTTNATFSTTGALIALGGSATDLQGVVRVTWENNRGGGGEATGTNAWTIPNVQLAAGVNVLTVTAEDAQGNLAQDSLTVTATLPDTTPPVVIVNGPRPDAQFGTEAATVTLSGSVVDNIGVASVAWADALGNSGAASISGQTWSVGPIALIEGPNTITVTALDAAGNSGSDSVLLLRTLPDATPPDIVLDFPTLGETFWTESPTISVSGTASDGGTLARVEWSNNRGGSGNATGLQAWSVSEIPLQLGVNVLTVTAYDAAGNTQSDTLSVTRTLPPTVTPSIAGNGSISPNIALTVPTGGGMSFTAAPSAGFVIGQWLVNGVPVQNGGGSFALSDVVGNTSVQVKFFSTNASLALLVTSAGVLTPAFTTATTSYTVTVPNSVATFFVTPTLTEASATVAVNGTPAASANPSGAVNLSVGANLIETVVTAEDGVTALTYSTVVTRQSAVESWRQTRFGTSANVGDAADNADPNKNGIVNLLEYALGGDPIGGATGMEILPQAGLGTGDALQVTFNRYLDRTDLTMTVQSADSPAGPWTNLARSTAGRTFAALAPGVIASESGTGSTRTVTVADLYSVTDPTHPTRFMRIEVTR